MWQTPQSALYLRNKLRSNFPSDRDAISRYIRWLLKFPFLSGSTRKSVLPLGNVSLFCWFLPVQVGLLYLLLFTELFRHVQWTWIYSWIFSASCWLSLQTFCTEIGGLPQGLAEVVRDHFGGFLSSLGSGRADLCPHNPGWDELSCKEEAAHWGILGRADG